MLLGNKEDAVKNDASFQRVETFSINAFILLALGWAYFFWGLNILLHAGTNSTWGLVLLAMGGASPTAATMILLLKSSKEKRASFVQSLIRFKTIAANDWAFIVLLPSVVLFAAIGLSLFLTSPEPAFTTKPFQPFWKIFPFAAMVLIMGPVPEEIGWRGYLLGALYTKHSLLNASLLLAVVWSLWHLPLFFIEDYPLSLMLHQPASLLTYFMVFFPKCIVYSWLFAKTDRSIPATILFHFFINLWGMIWETSVAAQFMELVVWSALSIYLVWKEQRLFKPTFVRLLNGAKR